MKIMAKENTCEHGDHPAPSNKRFCSEGCAACELAEHPGGKAECAGICLQATLQRAAHAVSAMLSRVHPDGTVLGRIGFVVDLNEAIEALDEVRDIFDQKPRR